MSALLEGDPVSVVWTSGSRQEIRRAIVASRADSDSVFSARLIFHYRLHYDLHDPPRPATYNDGVELIANEGSRWCRGWEGPQVDALRTVVALSTEPVDPSFRLAR